MQAGSSLIGTSSATPVNALLGIRSLREEYAKPTQRPMVVSNLQIIEEHLAGTEGIASRERTELPRFRNLFESGNAFPVGVFLSALELGPTEPLNGRAMPYDEEVLILRDNLVAAYKPISTKIRMLHSKEISALPPRLLMNFGQAWCAWESTWLRNREVHAVEALQPLAKAILSLEPLLLSSEKERLLPWPRVQHQKAITLKCLEGFVNALSDLAACVLPSLRRELDPDPRLLLLMDHVLMLRGEQVGSCLQGVGSTPDVAFPERKEAPRICTGAHGARQDGKGVPVDTYAFQLLGTSVGDAVAAGKVSVIDGRPPQGASAEVKARAEKVGKEQPKGYQIHATAASHAVELLAAFEAIKDLLLSLKSTLEYIDPALDQDKVFVSLLLRFQKAFRKSKRLHLEPDNLV
jgi:hypothetical protein